MQIQQNAYNVRESAKYIGVSPPTMLKLLSEIPHKRVGKRVIVPKANLDKWLLNEGEK
jgi:excisionase family DNA binding protein